MKPLQYSPLRDLQGPVEAARSGEAVASHYRFSRISLFASEVES